MTLALVIAACAFYGASPAAFILETGDSVWDVATVDANGDGRNDVAAFCSAEGSVPLRKYLALFFARPDGGYPSTPSAILSLDPAVGAGSVAEIDGQAPKEFVAANQSFLRYYRFAEGSFVEAGGSEVMSLLPTGSKEPSFLRKAVFDVDGDGVDEWLIPVPGGYERNLAAVGRPPGPTIMSRIVGEPDLIGSIDFHDENVELPVTVRSEGDLAARGCPCGERDTRYWSRNRWRGSG